MIPQLNFKQLPFIRLLVPYVAGIGCISMFQNHFNILFFALLLITVLLVLVQIFSVWKKHFRLLSGIIIFNIFFLYGLFSFNSACDYHDFPEHSVLVTGIVKHSPEIKERSIQIDCQAHSYSYKNRKIDIREYIRLYVSKDTVPIIPGIGDSICFTSKLQRITNRGNPGEFDYKKHMRNKRIHYTAYALHEDVIYGRNSGRFLLKRLAKTLQKKIIQNFERHSINDNELAILSALVAGNRDLLNDEIRNKFSVAGAMHVLAVSGLHVGILYLFLNMLLFRRNQTPFFRFFKLSLIVIVIWFFAFITGLSSPVVRAALMFSLFLTGKSFNRHINSYNILAASALIALLIDPLELFNPGFQFSYLAVLGILYIQPRLVNSVVINHVLLDRAWQLVTVSIAAQVSIFPLSLLYFHQFPTYFWLTTVFIIPLVWLIMVLTIVLFLSIPISPLVHILSSGLNYLLKSMYLLIEGVSRLPLASISNIRFEIIHLCAAYFFIILLLIAVRKFKKVYTVYTIGIGIVFFLFLNLLTYNRQERMKEIIVYNYGKNSTLSFLNGHNHLMLSHAHLKEDSASIKKWNHDFQVSRKLVKTTEYSVFQEIPLNKTIYGQEITIERKACGIFIHCPDEDILIYEGGTLIPPDGWVPGRTEIDWLIIGRFSGYPVVTNITHFMPKHIVISEHISKNMYNAWDKFAKGYKIDIHHVISDGALYIKLK